MRKRAMGLIFNHEKKSYGARVDYEKKSNRVRGYHRKEG